MCFAWVLDGFACYGLGLSAVFSLDSLVLFLGILLDFVVLVYVLCLL